MDTPNTSDNNSGANKAGKWSRKKLVAIFGAASLLAVGAFATTAQSGGFFGHRMGGCMNGKDHSKGGNYDPVKFEQRLDKKLKHFAIEFDVTDEQQAKLKPIITSLMKEVRPVKAKLHETREQLHKLLVQPKIDRAAIESLRSEKIALVDTVSKKITGALADAGEILNQQQREKLGEFLKNRRGHGRRGWHRS